MKQKYLLSTIALMGISMSTPMSVYAQPINQVNNEVTVLKKSVLPSDELKEITYTDKDYEPIIGKLTCDQTVNDGCACTVVTDPLVTTVAKSSIDPSSLTPKELITEGSTAPTAAPLLDLEDDEEPIDDVNREMVTDQTPATLNDPITTTVSDEPVDEVTSEQTWSDETWIAEETWSDPTAESWVEPAEETWTEETWFEPTYSVGDAVADAALSLVGSTGMDCYDVVEYALGVAGWNGSYASGTQVGLDQLSRGDIILYPSHYSVYVGNGQAVHGGYNGSNVILGDIIVGKTPYTAYHLG